MHFDIRLWRMTAGLRGRIALGHGARAAGAGARHRPLRLPRPVPGAAVRGAPAAALILPLVATLAAILLRPWLDHARTMIAHRTAARVQEALRGRLFDKIVALGPAWFGAERTGGVMLSMVDGVEQLQTFFGQYLPQVAIAACAPVAIFAFIAWWDVPVAAVMLAAALFTLLPPAAVHRAHRPRIARTAARVQGVRRGVPRRGAGPADAEGVRPERRLRRHAGGARRARCPTARSGCSAPALLTRGFTDLGSALGAAAGAGTGRLARAARRDEPGGAADRADGRHRDLPSAARSAHGAAPGPDGQAAATAINALLDAPITRRRPAARAHRRPSRSVPTQIEFERRRLRLSRRPPRGAPRPVVRHRRRRARRHRRAQRLRQVHHRAAAAAAARSAERARSASAATICARSIRTAMRRMIAVVAQDTYLFHGTVEDNLRLGRPDASDAELVAAARAANAHDFIEALPDGYQTVIGERGTRLSGGQRQRIAIARALLRDAPILVLDEALSSVDAENEAVIQQALDRLMTGRTTLILAHRLSSVIGADRILVLEDGAVVQSGSHAELIARDGPYRRLMGPQLAERSDADRADGAARHARRDASADERDRRGGARPGAGCRRGRLAGDDPRAAGASSARGGASSRSPCCGIGRVVAFIGVSVLGALVIAAVRGNAAVAAAGRAAAGAAPSRGCCTGWNPGWRTPWRISCWPRCGSTCFASWTRWRRPICCGAARAIWWRWRRRTSRRSNISSPIPSPRRSSRCWCRAPCWSRWR